MGFGRVVPLAVFAVSTAGLVTSVPAGGYDATAGGRVALIATPNAGIQPQAAVDGDGILHLLYFKGDPAGGDLFYVRRTQGTSTFSAPIRVNSDPGTAIATGSVRGGHLAPGRNGWIHVAWDAARPIEQNGAKYSPMYYSRLAPSSQTFEPQRAIGRTVNLDGGSIASDAGGHVYLVWHARGRIDGESHRALYVASSADDGAHFEPERALVEDGGVCACCAVAALADRDGRLNVMYRSATDGQHRDATWLVTEGSSQGASRGTERLGQWDLNACPMTTFALAQSRDSVIGAWQTEHQIFFSTLDPGRVSHSPVRALSGTGVRAHPSVAVNARGERVIAWTDGTGWSRGGTLSWELQSAAGIRRDGRERLAPVPAWGLVSALALRDGSFAIVY